MAEKVVQCQCCMDEVVSVLLGRPVRSGPSVPRVNQAGGAFVSLASRHTRRDMHTAATTRFAAIEDGEADYCALVQLNLVVREGLGFLLISLRRFQREYQGDGLITASILQVSLLLAQDLARLGRCRSWGIPWSPCTGHRLLGCFLVPSHPHATRTHELGTEKFILTSSLWLRFSVVHTHHPTVRVFAGHLRGIRPL